MPASGACCGALAGCGGTGRGGRGLRGGNGRCGRRGAGGVPPAVSGAVGGAESVSPAGSADSSTGRLSSEAAAPASVSAASFGEGRAIRRDGARRSAASRRRSSIRSTYWIRKCLAASSESIVMPGSASTRQVSSAPSSSDSILKRCEKARSVPRTCVMSTLSGEREAARITASTGSPAKYPRSVMSGSPPRRSSRSAASHSGAPYRGRCSGFARNVKTCSRDARRIRRASTTMTSGGTGGAMR